MDIKRVKDLMQMLHMNEAVDQSPKMSNVFMKIRCQGRVVVSEKGIDILVERSKKNRESLKDLGETGGGCVYESLFFLINYVE